MQAELSKKFLEDQLPKSLAALENLLKENKGGDGFFVGDAVRYNAVISEPHNRIRVPAYPGCFAQINERDQGLIDLDKNYIPLWSSYISHKALRK